MTRILKSLVLICSGLIVFGSAEIKAETSSIGYISNSSSKSTPSTDSNSSANSSSSNNTASSNSTAQASPSDTNSASSDSNKSTTAKPAAEALSSGVVSAASTTTAVSSAGVSSNVQATSVQVEPYSGSAGLSIPIQVPPGRAGIQPNLALIYSSSNRQLGNAGFSWNLDLGSIQISSKKGVPKYDGTDIFTMEQAGATQDLVADPNTAGLYHMEVEGAFANIQYHTTYWVITDKKGIKYYYGNTSDSKQYDPANASHIFRWALNRVEDLNGNYMTISYLNDQGQIYPQTINYTGNDQSSLSTYAQVTINYGPATQPSTSYISKFLIETAKRINNISVSAASTIQFTYTFNYTPSQDTGRDLLQSVTQTGSDGASTLPPVTFTYSSVATNGSVTFNQASGWNIPSGLQFAAQGLFLNGNPTYSTNGVEAIDIDGDGYPDLIKYNANCGSGDPANGVYLNNHQNGWTLNPSYQWPAGVFLADQCSTSVSEFSTPSGQQISHNVLNKADDLGVRLIDVDGDGRPDIIQAYSQVKSLNSSSFSSIPAYNQGGWGTPSIACPGGSNVFNELAAQSSPLFDPFGYALSNYLANTAQSPVLSPCNYNNYMTSIDTILQSTLNISTSCWGKCSSTGAISNSNVFNFYLKQLNQFQSQNLSIPNNPVFSTESLLQTTGKSLGLPLITDTLTTALSSMTFADVTGDGFSDIVATGSAPYINLKGQNPSQLGWQQQTAYSVPNIGNFSNGTMMVDLNGDGLADMIQISASQGSFVYMNTGNGWVQDTNSPWLAGIDQTNCDFAAGNGTLVDLNGDGLPDLICNGSSQKVYLNTGHGWAATNGWSLPGINLTNLSTQFLDANADGLMDYMIYPASPLVFNGFNWVIGTPSTPQLYLNPASAPSDLLIGVNNGIGAQTALTYDSALHYQNTYLPYYMPVVKSTTTTVGGQSYTTIYNYAGGLWDTNYREFDGFSTVKIIDPDGNYVTSIYLQDHWSKGRPSEQDTYDSSGNLYSKSVNTWVEQPFVTNTTSNQISKFLYISRTDNYLYDGNSSATPKRTAQEFTYGENPQYGDPTQVINDGQIDPVAGTSIDPNRTVSLVTYVNNTSNFLIGLPSTTITQNTSGTTISKQSFYYDGDTTGTAEPVFGRLTTKVNWLGSATQADPKTAYTYDAYGNLQSTTDPKGNITTITYDNTVHMFPEQTSNALNQKVTMTYYGIDTAPLNNGQGLQGLWGQDRSKTDANNQTAYTTYDVFGRPSTSISPLDTVALPTEQKTYNIQPTYIAVTDTARVTNGSSATISTVSYYDGLGRLIETKSLGPTAGQYIASGQTVYDNRGLPITKYLPYFTSNSLNTMDAINTSVPSSQALYDPMGRIITKTNPDGTHSSVTYNQWTTTTTDENGHMQQNFVDAFGRLIQKEEYTGADGRSPNYLSTPYALYATTSYSYNPQGNLTSVMDAHNNVTTITYDNLGRKIGMNDPDMGKWQYGYDGNSNLIWQEDAKGQVISFTYDALNRLLNKTDAISGPIVNLPALTPHAATFTVNYNFDDKTQSYGIGRLGSVAYDTGTAGFIYDQLGRENTSNKTINGTVYNVTRQYDALNRLKQLQYPDGSQVAYVYNQAGAVSGVADAGTGTNVYIKAINYNALGQITQIQYGNGVTTAYTYDPLCFRLTRIYSTNAQALVEQDLNYTYDSIGQVMSIKDNVNTGTQAFTYDALNRLTSAQNVTYGSKTYAYDAIGNITLKDGLSYTYSGAGPHAVTSLSDGSVFKYDANGNMISDQKGSNLTQYAYDSQNRLITVTVGSLKVAAYAYDGDGGRIQKIVYRRDLALYNDNTNALLFGNLNGTPLPATVGNQNSVTTTYVGNVYETETPASAGVASRKTKFIYLGSTKVAEVDSSGNVYFYHTDHLGGTNVLTDKTGTLRELTEYDPFGQVITHEKFGNDFATAWYYFTGKPLDDETGLVFLGARYYNPGLGRFISPDTVVQAPSNPQTLNRYTYCNNNPVNLVDPSGHSWFSKLFKAIGKFFENLVEHPIQTILNIVGIVVGVVTGNPFLVAASAINLFDEGTSTFHGGAWNTIHQVGGYASLALSVAGGVQAIGNAFNAAARASLMNSMGLSDAPFYQPMANMTGDELTSIFNNSVSTVGQQIAAANELASSATTTISSDITLGSPGIANGQLLSEPSNIAVSSLGPTGSLSQPTIVIGENMTGRVVPFAQSIGAEYYQPTQSILEIGPVQALENNESWLIDKLNAGYQVIDRGIDPARDARSVFYDMESKTYMEWKTTSTYGTNK